MQAKKIAYNTIVSFVSRVLGTLGALLVVGLMTRYLGEAGYGSYNTILAFLYIFSVLADLGLYSISVREISKEGANETEIITHAFSLRFWAGFFIFALAPVIAWLFPYSLDVKLGIILAALGSWFLSNAQVLMGVFQKYLKMERVALADLAGRIVQLGLVILVVIKNLGFFAVILTYTLSSFVNFLLAFIFARKYILFKIGWNVSYWKKMLKSSLPLAISAIFVMIYFKLDTVMLSLMKPAEDVGIYGVAYKILETLIFFPAMFVGLVMPLLSKNASVNLAEFKRIAQKTFDVLLFFAMPLAVGGLFLSKQIIHLVAGQGFDNAAGVLQILVFATAIIFFGSLFSSMIIAAEKQRALAKIYAIGAVVNFSVNLILIPKFSYWGAASSTLFTELLVTGLMVVAIKKYVGFSPVFSAFLKIILASSAMAATLFLLRGSNLLISLFAGMAVYFSVFFFFGRSFLRDSILLLRKEF